MMLRVLDPAAFGSYGAGILYALEAGPGMIDSPKGGVFPRS